MYNISNADALEKELVLILLFFRMLGCKLMLSIWCRNNLNMYVVKRVFQKS